ncbi:MAG: hypothetical protein KA792_08180, partial [Bacteroidales bacterium]|nr:hypothetical protein [Bacteroidales bacterium]
METQEKNKFIKLIIIIIATFISILIIIAGMLYYNYEYNKIKTEKYEQLRTISQLKISQLSLWNDRNIAVATVNSKSPFLFNEIENWLLSQKDVESKNKIIERLKLSATYHHYENIIISSPNGIPLLSIKQNFNAFDSIPKTAIKEAAKTQDIKFTYFYESTLDSNAIYYDVMSPLVNSQDETIAVLVFRIDP